MGEAKRRGSAANRSTTNRPRDEFEQSAAEIDQAYRQLLAEGLSGAATISRMAAHLQSLQRIYDTVSDEKLMALAARYPGFKQFAETMEDASEQQRAQGPHLPKIDRLPAALLPTMQSLLEHAGELERDSADGSNVEARLPALRARATAFGVDVDQFLNSLEATRVSRETVAMAKQILDDCRQRIGVALASASAADDSLPLSRLPEVSAFVARQIVAIEALLSVLEPALRRDGVIDNDVVLRVQNAVAMHGDSLTCAEAQLISWSAQDNPSSSGALKALDANVQRWAALNQRLANVAMSVQRKTFETIMAMGDAELAAAVLTGKLQLPPIAPRRRA